MAIRAYLIGKEHTWYSEINGYLYLGLAAAELLTCLFSTRRRAIHDLIARTVVIKRNPARWYLILLTIALTIAAMAVQNRAWDAIKSSSLRF
jgi:hypothetical protein